MTTYDVDKTSVKLAELFRDAEEKAAEQRGGFTLFGLFQVEDVPGQWELVAAAPWLKGGSGGIRDLVEIVEAAGEYESRRQLARVVPMNDDSDFVEAITRRYRLEHALEEIGNVYVNGVYITHAFLITSNLSPASVLPEPVAA